MLGWWPAPPLITAVCYWVPALGEGAYDPVTYCCCWLRFKFADCCSEAGRPSYYLPATTPDVFVRNLDFEFAELALGGILLLYAAVDACISMKF